MDFLITFVLAVVFLAASFLLGVGLIKLGLSRNDYKLCNSCHKKIPVRAEVCPYCLRRVGYNGALGANVIKPRTLMGRFFLLAFGAIFVMIPFIVIIAVINEYFLGIF